MKRGPKPSPQKDPSIHVSKSPGMEASESALKSEPGVQLKRKRSQFAAVAVRKRPRKSSVQSQTLSVTRISVPVHEGNISPKSEKEGNPSKSTKINSSSSPNQSLPLIAEAPKKSQNSQNNKLEVSSQLPPKKPRHLRVSLSLPEEVEPGSPLEKIVMKSEKPRIDHSPNFSVSSLPLWDDDPKAQVKLSSSSETPTVKSPVHSTSDCQTNVVSNQSPTPSNEGPLTPFTASALPLKSGVENKDRKRKSADEGDAVNSATPPPKRPNLSSPLADDVFTSPITSGANVVQRQTITSSKLQPELQSADKPSPAAKDVPSTESQMDTNILPGATTTPVGYGTQATSAQPEPSTPAAATSTVITVQPSLEDKALGVTPKPLSPTSKAELITPVEVTVAKEPRLESVTTATLHVSKTPALPTPTATPALPTPSTAAAVSQAVPESKVITSLPLPQTPPTTEQSKQALSPEKVAAVISIDASVSPSRTVSLPQQSKSPGVIVSSPRQSVSTVTSSAGHSHSAAMPLVKSTPNLAKKISTRVIFDDASRSSAAAVSVITTAPITSTTSTPTSGPTAVSHVKPAQNHTPKTHDHDIIITSVEMKPQSSTGVKTPLSLPSYTEAVQSKTTIPPISMQPTTAVTTLHAVKGRTQNVFVGGKYPGQPGTKKVTAKIAVSLLIRLQSR